LEDFDDFDELCPAAAALQATVFSETVSRPELRELMT